MGSRIYAVATERFGDIHYSTDEGIRAARRWARGAFGITNPRAVRAVVEHKVCAGCSCAPCAAGCRRG